jgi:hypothetical protein
MDEMKKWCKCMTCLIAVVGSGVAFNRSINYAAIGHFPNGVVRAYISNRPVIPVAQDNIVGCWAASLSALFGYFGHPVSQDRIRLRYFPPGVIRTGPPWVMMDALNTTWTDDSGNNFRIKSLITNFFPSPYPPYAPQGPTQAGFGDIVKALANEMPVLYGDRTHAMVLVQADYVSPYNQIEILGAGAIDPAPQLCPPWAMPCNSLVATGFRQLQQNELSLMFVGVPVSVDDLP